jgi:hypothetical protein
MISDETMKQGGATMEELVIKTINEKDQLLIPKSYKYDSVLVFLHGEGDVPASYVQLFVPNTATPEMGLPKGLMGNAKIVLPCAKRRFLFKDNKPAHIHIWFNLL